MRRRPHRPTPTLVVRRAALGLAAALAVLALPMLAQAATGSASGLNSPASADLRFAINIDKFLFLRVGAGAFPTQSGSIDSVTFNLTPNVPGGPANPPAGNNQATTWTGAAPSFTASPSGSVALPVEVRSNGGQVTLRASVTPLASGANTLPISDLSVSSSDSALPAPPIPASGSGTTVNVTGTAFGGRVTQRAATWTFAFASSTSPAAGTYSGQITFTASTP